VRAVLTFVLRCVGGHVLMSTRVVGIAVFLDKVSDSREEET